MDRITKEILLFIMNHIHEAVHITDSDGTLIYANPAAEVLEQVSAEEMVGKSSTNVYTHTDYESGSLPPSLIVLETGVPRIDENCEYFSQKGEVVNSIVSNYPYTPPTEQSKTMVCSVSENIGEMRKRLIKYGGIDSKHTYRLRKKLMKNGTIYIFDDIIGESPVMKNAIDIARRFAAKKMPVMIFGETGTGKEVFAQSIHNASEAMHHNFVPINCAAIPENLLESILFGTVKGAFTGALDKEGLFEKAQNGTIFLDEINSMPVTLQAKILRVLQEKEVQRIGDNVTRPLNCRIISATNKHPIEAIKRGELREDLYYRLSVGLVFLPSLRERESDISLLARYYLEKSNVDFGSHIYQISDELMELFTKYLWPGNIRELSNTIESAMNLTTPEDIILSVNHLPAYIRSRFENDISITNHIESGLSGDYRSTDSPIGDKGLKDSVESFEKYMLTNSLKEQDGNIQTTANILKITRQGLEKKLKKYNIDATKYRPKK